MESIEKYYSCLDNRTVSAILLKPFSTEQIETVVGKAIELKGRK